MKVASEVIEFLKVELAVLVDSTSNKTPTAKDEKIQDLLVECAAVVATYNMVSRFLVALDVAGMLDEPVPWPVDRQEVSLSNSSLIFAAFTLPILKSIKFPSQPTQTHTFTPSH